MVLKIRKKVLKEKGWRKFVFVDNRRQKVVRVEVEEYLENSAYDVRGSRSN